MILTGCQTTQDKHSRFENEAVFLSETDQVLDQGQFYQAKKLTREFLADNPDSVKAQQLMAEILEKEIAAQKQAFSERVPEEYDVQDKDDQIRTWLERAESFLREKRYPEAMESAEQVFTLDPENAKASNLVDRIRGEALTGQVADKAFLKEMRQDELLSRADRYKKDAVSYLESGRYGAAELAIKKVLLIFPEDKEANQIYQRIQVQEESRLS